MSQESAVRDEEEVERLTEWLFERAGGTYWLDQLRAEARRWFAYADLLADVAWLADVAETNAAAYEHAACGRRQAKSDEPGAP